MLQIVDEESLVDDDGDYESTDFFPQVLQYQVPTCVSPVRIGQQVRLLSASLFGAADVPIVSGIVWQLDL